MQDGHGVAQAGAKFLRHPWGERNLRHQHQGGLPRPQGMLDQPEVDFRLAAAGHAVQEHGRKPAGAQRGDQGLQGFPLLLGQDPGLIRAAGVRPPQGIARHLLPAQPDQSPLLQALQGRPGEGKELAKTGQAQHASGVPQVGDQGPLVGGEPGAGQGGFTIGMEREKPLFLGRDDRSPRSLSDPDPACSRQCFELGGGDSAFRQPLQ